MTIRGTTVTSLEVLFAVITRNMERNAASIPEQQGHELHFAIGRGRRNGKPAVVRIEVIVRPDLNDTPYIDACTSMNASIAAQLILASPKRPGVYAPESYFDVPAYVAELRKRKFEVRTVIEE